MSERLDALAAALGETAHDRGSWHLLAQCDHATLADAMRRAGIVADALVVDAPYSERCHRGHDQTGLLVQADRHSRRETPYIAWDNGDVGAFVATWAPLVGGWICSLTDHVLAPAWDAHMSAGYRYVFSPIACVEIASRARLMGDGPSQWSTWLIASRPRSRRWSAWGTLDGAYVGKREEKPVVGGKPLWLMRAIVGDYSRPGDLVVDPCAGGGTTLVAAIELGRLAIGCEPDEGRYEIARARCAKARPQLRMALDVTTEKRTQSALDLTTEAR